MNQYPVTKNQELTVDIIDLTHEGMGIAKVDGYPLFIENALPGEKVTIHVLKVGNKFGFAKVKDFLKKSPDRIENADERYIRTGIAPLAHLSYEKQLLFKQQQVENVMKKVAKMPDVAVLPTIGMTNPTGYRNKAQIPVRRIDGQLQTGFYRKNSHDLMPIENFYIQDPAIDQAIVTIREILQKYQVKAYNETTHEGFLRHIVIRRGHYTHQMMVVLVTRKTKFFKGTQIAQEIAKALPEVVSIIQNINEEKTNVILGEHEQVLYGSSTIEDQLLGKTYQISAKSFYQVNTIQAERLYQTAYDFAKLTAKDIIIDAYSGIGTIGLSVADKVKHVYGMEVVADAVQDAIKNAKLNGLTNTTYVTGNAETVMAQWVKDGIQPTVIFVDPPRKGLTPSFIKASCEMNPEKIVYISCNPATMARDLALFNELGYAAQQVQPVDLFPMTNHVETVVLITRL
ncbi:23S rRNA (uracil(1939)-C(5))-methyltransferase RlmD [Enterococcus columbae]|uniref:23S rRNA (Uracil-5-)-methyltransferase RumA n=1 Tax=Enterococcus columbae DSM 7374 = ATCC 51263 TaxID=1121865 RepID=S1P2U4_9ENTE|nr:23S rRNA (uracil(1939)-C(5))-methyltransferase RlmD [Enterococcus columbae]EOT43562.1 23S rRNA (uracil-5-)-methyltransferase RumA [Enterococcus columbae DSM 7374 = ATCC 51263]EOW87384.1 23S rRNA (uracil-5-)-methyltransferase RumA [Enterococcus columbae DSM 7374 = ATCC 51263]OJG21551.1 23S rRNA (uracil-5-)-methyltransferase RumA [Enterococcus columbae DSM 7374 = ATCC 51263]